MVVQAIARRLLGSSTDRRIKRLQPKVEAINALEPELEKLSDDQLRARTAEFRQQVENGAKLEDVLVPAFATVREGSKRALGMRHFDVQLIGGMVLNESSIAEMKTGEGKTLVATLAVYLNALQGKGVHVVTVNDYLAGRDAEWMGHIYRFLGLEVGTIVHDMSDEARRAAYAADVTYGTNNEMGFDYLRDNMKYSRATMVQRGHNFAIVDEVDSILIDEARTPLIISGPSEDRSALYKQIDLYMPIIEEGDYELEEKHRSATFTDQGIERLEERLTADGVIKGESLYDIENVSIVHHLNNALRAHKLFQRDKDYIVRNDEVVIIDEFTGRMMPGRRFSEGLHQALEAKEHVAIHAENQTLASITFQNYFRLYGKLAGMTGTAETEAEEFADIYGLAVVSIPTNVPVKREDEDDAVYRTAAEKNQAIAELVAECRERGQPVLVGTTSIEKSEHLAELLKKKGVKDLKILNARHHEQEAQIIADAGVSGAVTIATNMAGRGTDIQLGGNPDMRIAGEATAEDGTVDEKKAAKIRETIAEDKKKVIAAGGLYVLGTERHESRRIDNQLRGRSGRQGDPGHSKFFLSLQDDLMRIFPIERMDTMLERLGLEENESITHPWVTKAIERAQAKVEARNFDIRKNILKYDDVMNDQRKVIFEQRLELMDSEDVNDTITDMRHDVVDAVIERHIPERAYPEQWNTEGLTAAAKTYLNADVPVADWAGEEGIDAEIVRERLMEAADEVAKEREEEAIQRLEESGRSNTNVMRQVEKSILLQSIDGLWREHLVTLDHLSKVVGWRGLAQRDPLNEYKQEAYELFNQMLTNLRELVTTQLAHVALQVQPPAPPPSAAMRAVHADPVTGENEADSGGSTGLGSPGPAPRSASAAAAAMASGGGTATATADPASRPLTPEQMRGVRRNDPCPCGSGKKFKHCHGAF